MADTVFEAHRVPLFSGDVVIISVPASSGDEWQRTITDPAEGMELRFGVGQPYSPVTLGAQLDDPFRLLTLIRNGDSLLLLVEPPARWGSDTLAMRWPAAGIESEVSLPS